MKTAARVTHGSQQICLVGALCAAAAFSAAARVTTWRPPLGGGLEYLQLSEHVRNEQVR
jgi:hypothetical protein